MSDERLEEVLAKELAAYQEQLDRQVPGASPDSSSNGQALSQDDPSLPAEWKQELAEQKRCLDLLHALRRPEPVRGKPAYRHEPDHAAQATERFQRLDELGSGGFGVVWRARDPVTGRIVALKIPRPEVLASPELWKRFEQEAEAAARLDHPNIVPILEAGADGVVPYIASVYYEGPTLARWLAEHPGPVPPRQAALVALALAKALTHAHERGVLHRDVKPSNVLLAPLDGGEQRELAFEPKLMDFGLAKLGERDQELTRTGAMLGTLKYMAPEQAAGRAKEITAATDVYGLGVVLYEMLAGKPPFSAESDWLTLRQVLEDEPRSVSTIRRDVPRDLAVIVQKCLSKLPAQRYRTARELAEDLDRYLSGKAILARPVPMLERLAKWCRRNPAWAALFAVVALGMLAGMAFLSYSNVRISAALASEKTLRGELTSSLASEKAAREQLAMRLYAADIRRADEAFDQSNINLAREVLSPYSRNSGTDMREFAWRFLWDRIPYQKPFVGKHPGAVYSVQLSSDGKHLATAGADRYVRVWRPGAEQAEHALSCGPGEVNEVAFSPDGKLLAAASSNGRLLVWNTAGWTQQHALEIGGVVVADFQRHSDRANAVAVQENKMILTAGTGAGEGEEGLVYRFEPRGRPDRSFRETGHSTFLFGPGQDGATSLLVETDGKVVVVGYSSGDNFIVGRMHPNGSPDLTFGEQGYASIDLGSSEDMPLALARLADGRYVVCGSTRTSEVEVGQGDRYDVALIRLLNDGALDPTFGDGGKLTTSLGPGRARAASLALQADGKIVIAGNRRKEGSEAEDIIAVRYNVDGSLDGSFGTDGCVELGFCDADDLGNSVAIQPDGKIVIAGRADFDGVGHAVAIRLEPDGSLDGSFGGAGIVRVEFDRPNSAANSVLVQPDGMILLAGAAGIGTQEAFALARLKPDGTLDETFGRGGRTTLQVGYGSGLSAITLMANGEIVACGYAKCGGTEADASNLAVARFLPNGTPDRGLSSSGAQGLLFTRDSKRLISYTHQCIRIWDMATGQILKDVYIPEHSLEWVELSSDESKLIAAGKRCRWMWNFNDLDAPPSVHTLGTETSTAVSLASPDELVIGYVHGKVNVLNTATGEDVRLLKHTNLGRVRRLRLSADRKLLAMMFINSVTVFRTDDWTLVGDIVVEGRLFDVHFMPGGKSMLLSNMHGVVSQWQLPADGVFVLGTGAKTLHTAQSKIFSMAFSHDRDWLALGDSLGGTTVLDVGSGQVIRNVNRPGGYVRGLAFASPNELVVGHASGHIDSVPLPDGASRGMLELKHPIKILQASADGRHLAVAFDDALMIDILAWPSGTLVTSIPQKDEVSVLMFTSRGTELVVTGAAHLEVFDVATGKRLGGEFRPGNTYNAVQLIGDGSQILVAEGLNGIALRELPSCRVIRRMLGDVRGIVQVAVSPDGRNLVSGGPTRSVRIWDTQSWEQVLTIEYAYPENSLTGMGFSRTNNRIFGVFDKNVVVWDAPDVE